MQQGPEQNDGQNVPSNQSITRNSSVQALQQALQQRLQNMRNGLNLFSRRARQTATNHPHATILGAATVYTGLEFAAHVAAGDNVSTAATVLTPLALSAVGEGAIHARRIAHVVRSFSNDALEYGKELVGFKRKRREEVSATVVEQADALPDHESQNAQPNKKRSKVDETQAENITENREEEKVEGSEKEETAEGFSEEFAAAQGWEEEEVEQVLTTTPPILFSQTPAVEAMTTTVTPMEPGTVAEHNEDESTQDVKKMQIN